MCGTLIIIAFKDCLLVDSEFTLAEIEHFCSPDNKDHPKFKSVGHIVVRLFSAHAQETGGDIIEKTIADAVSEVC